MSGIEEEITDEILDKIIEAVYVHTGIKMSQGKRNLLSGRLRPRMRALSIKTFKGYLEFLNTSQEERQIFVNLVTTNETSFFRTQKVWDYFENEFLPNWFKDKKNQTLKIWSAASSSGEEAYGIAICCEEFGKKNPGFAYKITGTDISTNVLQKASKGEYSGKTMELLKSSKPWAVERYFEETVEGIRVKNILSANIKFTQHNLFSSPSKHGSFDIVFLRNVLIYFQTQDQEKVLDKVQEALPPSGILIIGESESLSSLKTQFKYLAPLIYQKVEK